jgi:DMSO/TMAO reductase YedYZ molybdopterin-dependent catalytic subunit
MKWTKDSGKVPPKSPAVRRVMDDHEKFGDRLPPGQIRTEKWPVLQYGRVPRIDLRKWRFTLSGLVEEPVTLDWDAFTALPRSTLVNDIHCVTHWSRFDNTWEGVLARDLLATARIQPEARFAMVHGFDGYTTNVPLDILMGSGAILAYRHDGEPLSEDHGWPCRLVMPPEYYFWKSAKWVSGLELIREDAPGLWERNGYHMRGNPFLEERYSP